MITLNVRSYTVRQNNTYIYFENKGFIRLGKIIPINASKIRSRIFKQDHTYVWFKSRVRQDHTYICFKDKSPIQLDKIIES